MSLIKRYIDINFDVDARPLKRVPGTIVQGNNKVNVLRITYPNISSDHVVVALTQRADEEKGSTFLDYSVNSGSFELVLHNWFTAVSGEVQITFAIYSQTPEINEEGIITTETDTLRKVYLNVEESISADLPAPEDESIFLDVAVMVKTYDARIEKLETYFITDLNALDNFTTPGVYKINFNNNNVFHLFVIRIADSLIEQTRSSKQGYYIRTIYNSIPNEWIYSKYNIDGKSDYDSTISYKKGAIVNYFGDLYLSLIDDNNTPLTVAWKKLDFASFVNRFELSGFVPKEEGKGLSSNDFTTEEKTKIANLKQLAFKDGLFKADVGLGNVRDVESYSKQEVDSKISNIKLDDYYTKIETEEKLQDVVEIAEGKTSIYVVYSFYTTKLNKKDNRLTFKSSDFPIRINENEYLEFSKLKTGDLIYIDSSYPDRWVYTIKDDEVVFFAIEAKSDFSGYEKESNKISAITSASTTTQYPNAKAVFNYVNEYVDGYVDAEIFDLEKRIKPKKKKEFIKNFSDKSTLGCSVLEKNSMGYLDKAEMDSCSYKDMKDIPIVKLYDDETENIEWVANFVKRGKSKGKNKKRINQPLGGVKTELSSNFTLGELVETFIFENASDFIYEVGCHKTFSMDDTIRLQATGWKIRLLLETYPEDMVERGVYENFIPFEKIIRLSKGVYSKGITKNQAQKYRLYMAFDNEQENLMTYSFEYFLKPVINYQEIIDSITKKVAHRTYVTGKTGLLLKFRVKSNIIYDEQKEVLTFIDISIEKMKIE